jgi:hypothetical protein
MNDCLKLLIRNTCDIHETIYQSGFEQRLYLPAYVLNPIYEIVKEGGRDHEDEYLQNGGMFIKRYEYPLGAIPEFILDALFEASCCNSLRLIMRDNSYLDIEDLQIEYEWITECYADVKLKFIEKSVSKYCCNNYDLNTEPIVRTNCELLQFLVEINGQPTISGCHIVLTPGFITGNAVIDWGDGVVEIVPSGIGKQHTYALNGVYKGKMHHVTDGNYNMPNIVFYTYENCIVKGWDLGSCYAAIENISISFQESTFKIFYAKDTWVNLEQLTISNVVGYMTDVFLPDECAANLYHLWTISCAMTDLEHLLVSCDNSGVINGSFNASAGTSQGLSALSTTANAARLSLIAKGWTITLNA